MSLRGAEGDEAIPSSRCEGIPSFKIHDAEAISCGGFPAHPVKQALQSQRLPRFARNDKESKVLEMKKK